ncbi:MAG: hypothetical protein F6J92_07890, partial [Symploca sp. SIO1A3]|nr:hypothetical protein [Symploca sp. SIO1A3]
LFPSMLLGATFASLSIAVSSTSATAFTYNETVDGDLPGFASDSPIFALDIGKNTFTGEQTFSAVNDLVPTDFDSFAFSIPDGAFLESVLIDIGLLPIGSGIFSRTSYSLNDSPFVRTGNIGRESIFIPSNNRELFVSSLPVGSGSFFLDHGSVGGALPGGQFRTASYTFSLNVTEITSESVPESNNIMGLLAFGMLITCTALKKKLLVL